MGFLESISLHQMQPPISSVLCYSSVSIPVAATQVMTQVLQSRSAHSHQHQCRACSRCRLSSWLWTVLPTPQCAQRIILICNTSNAHHSVNSRNIYAGA
jgi:hypothetical protein